MTSARMAVGAAAGVACLLLALAGACVEPPGLDELLDQRIVVTQFDPNADFASFTTFAMVDSISVYGAFDAGTPLETVDPALAGPTLAEIASQLESRGYRQVDRSAHPDLGVNVEAFVQLRVATVTQYGTWWGYGTASPGYWGFSGTVVLAPFGYQTIAWRSGTLVIELYDLRDARPPNAVDPPIAVVWGALIHGVIGPVGGPPLTTAPIAAIQQCFAQSPYLGRD